MNEDAIIALTSNIEYIYAYMPTVQIYADRVFEARSILSVALARTTAISLLAGATTLTSSGLDL